MPLKYNGTFISYEWDMAAANQPLFDTEGYMRAVSTKLLAELKKEGEIVKRAFERTTATWVYGDHWARRGEATLPVFEIEIGQRGSEHFVFITTDSKIYQYINNGTDERFATMPKGYRSKSQPRVIGSRGGGGMPLYVNKKVRRKGIEAREFVDEIADRREKYFYDRMYKAIDKIFEKYWMKATGRRY